jgi:hypothetical protein
VGIVCVLLGDWKRLLEKVEVVQVGEFMGIVSSEEGEIRKLRAVERAVQSINECEWENIRTISMLVQR